MARIFINYRRDDSQGVAGRLFDRLTQKYSRRELFMDVDAMQAGIDFAKQLDTQVSQCQVLLAVIGPHWLDAHDQAGRRRLDNEKDYVRVELASALKRDIAVIPVLLDGAVMPSEDNLSDDLKPLALRHALELRHTRFNADADAIAQALEAVVPRSRVPWRYVVPAAIAGVAVIASAVLGPKLFFKPQPQIAMAPAHLAPAAVPATPAPVAAPAPQPASASPPVLAPAPLPPAENATLVPQTAPAAAVAANSTAGLPPGTRLGEMMQGIIFHGINLLQPYGQTDAASCQADCRKNPACTAWSFVLPKPNGEAGLCGLKAVTPEELEDRCCTSAIERAPPPDYREPPPVPATMVGERCAASTCSAAYTVRLLDLGVTPELCQAACEQASQCAAWTYIRPGLAGPDARCSLKDKPPIVVHDTCCISGTKLLLNTDLPGSDYHRYPNIADVAHCQALCKSDTQCLAWSYVLPDAQTPSGAQVVNASVCYLKNRIPQPRATSCCTSNIERVEAK